MMDWYRYITSGLFTGIVISALILAAGGKISYGCKDAGPIPASACYLILWK